jgi:hypothetical protein
VEAAPGFEPGIKVLQTSALPLGYAATESGRRDSNPRPPPWQGGVLPLNYFRIMAGVAGFEPTHHGVKVRCLTAWLYPNNRRKGRLVGIEPTHARATIWCVNHFAIVATNCYSFMAGAVGIEPTPEVLETSVLPLNYAPA